MPRLSVVRATEEHSAVLAEFYREVWDPAATPEGVRLARRQAASENQASPGEDVPTFLALQDGRAVAHVTSIPIRLWNGERELPAHWVKGLMVLPESRNGPLGFLVLKAAVQQLPRSVALAVAPAARRLFGALGYADLGSLPNYLRLLRPGRVLGRLDLEQLGLARLPSWSPRLLRLAQRTGLALLAGGAGGIALRLGAALARGPRRGTAAEELRFSEAAPLLDALWRAAAPDLRGSVVRDGRYLRWRYGPRSQEGGTYRALLVRRRGEPSGALVLRRPSDDGDPRLRGVRVSTLSDVLFRPGDRDAGLALLGEAEHLARRQGADAILCSAAHATLAPLLRRQGYLPLPGNVHFFVRDVTGELPVLAARLGDWWLTRGDGESDEAF